MRHVPVLTMTMTMVAAVALAACTAGGGAVTPTATATATASAPAAAKVYSEDELRELISGLKDGDGNELRLYSREQVDQGGQIADVLLSTATISPEECKDIATAGLAESVETGDIAVAMSEGNQPRTLSAQSGSEGPDAVELLTEIRGNVDDCASFTVEALGQRYEVTSLELAADTEADETFATLSTRSGDTEQKLMQVSAAEGRLLVVATKGGANLSETDQQELEELVNDVFRRVDGATATPSPTGRSATSTSTAAPPSGATTPAASATAR